MPAFLAPLLIAAGSSIAGALSNRSKKVQTESTSTPTFAPEVRALLGQLAPHIMGQINNPAQGLDGLRVAGREQINQDYAGVPDMLAAKYGRNAGQGASGKFGSAAAGAEFNRLSQFAGLEQQLLQAALQRQDVGVQNAMQLLNLGRGQTNSGTQQLPGNILGGASGGLDTATFLYTLSKLQGGATK